MKLDVHILVMDYTRLDWQAQCFSSVETAAERAGFPVAVHIVPGIIGHLGQARLRGYSQGDAPYVTHVDDDDFVTPNAFAILADAMRDGVESITTGETLVYNDGRHIPSVQQRHHLAVYRRDFLGELTYRAFDFYPDQYILSRTKPVHLPECVYMHRINMDSGSRQQRRRNVLRAQQELEAIANRELFNIEHMSYAQLAALNDTAVTA